MKKHELPEYIDQSATYLAIEKETPVNRTNFANTLLQNLDSWYLILKDECYEYIV